VLIDLSDAGSTLMVATDDFANGRLRVP